MSDIMLCASMGKSVPVVISDFSNRPVATAWLTSAIRNPLFAAKFVGLCIQVQLKTKLYYDEHKNMQQSMYNKYASM